jgi:hypothetical protein
MTSLVYLARLQQRLPTVAKGMACTLHRIFLAALILAAKNLNDSSPKNKHWARYTTVRGYPGFGFSITEVNLMEKQMLFLLDWDLRVRNEDLYENLEPFLAPIRSQLVMQERIRRQQAQQQLLLEQQQRQMLVEQRPRYPAYSSYAVDAARGALSRTPSLSPPTQSSSSSSSPSVRSVDDDVLLSSADPSRCRQGSVASDTSSDLSVHIVDPSTTNSLKAAHTLHRVLSYDEGLQQKPAKKARVGGASAGFLARLLNPSRVVV